MIYLSIILILTYFICWFTFKGDNWYYMNAVFGAIATILYIYNRFRERRIIQLDENAAFVIFVLLFIILIFLIFRYLLKRYKNEWYEISIKIINDYYSQTFLIFHRVLFFHNKTYYHCVTYWTENFPESSFLRFFLFFIFQVLPISILILLFLFEGCQGYLYYSLKFLVLLGIPLILKIWVNLKIDLGQMSYNDILLVYEEIVLDKTLKIEQAFTEQTYDHILEGVQYGYEHPEIRPLFLGRSPEEYIEFSYSVLNSYINTLRYKHLLLIIRSQSYLSFLFVICLVLFINIIPLLNTGFLYYSYSFLVYLFYSFSSF